MGHSAAICFLKNLNTNGTTFTYANNLINATCFTNREVHVSLGVKADFSLKLAYRWCGFGFDLGYNVYGQSREKIELLAIHAHPILINANLASRVQKEPAALIIL